MSSKRCDGRIYSKGSVQSGTCSTEDVKEKPEKVAFRMLEKTEIQDYFKTHEVDIQCSAKTDLLYGSGTLRTNKSLQKRIVFTNNCQLER